jgi:hypothetical protein
MSDRTRSLCSAVKKEIRSAGDGEGVESGNKDIAEGVGCAREKLLLSEKAFDEVTCGPEFCMEGDGERVRRLGEEIPLRNVFEFQAPPFFLPPNARSSDHSDSN